MLKGARGRRGFTLIETVVTVGIVATLAAVVVPQVVKQFDAADPTRLQNDLKGLQTAIETFNVNTKTYPSDLDDLANAITTADSALGVATTLPVYLSSQTTFWKGPYVDFSVIEAALPQEFRKTTGFGATILDSFVCYASGNNEHGVSAEVEGAAAANDAACPGTGSGQKFLAIQITGLAAAATDANFLALNALFDGANEATPATTGRVRFEADVGTANIDVVYFLVIPIS